MASETLLDQEWVMPDLTVLANRIGSVTLNLDTRPNTEGSIATPPEGYNQNGATDPGKFGSRII